MIALGRHSNLFRLLTTRRTQEEFFKGCKFIIADEDGYMLENSTYTGVLGVLSRNEADLKTRLGVTLIGDFFHFTSVCSEGE